jgi:hypothetical protein
MGVVSRLLQERKLTRRVYTPIREFLVGSCAVGIFLIAYNIFFLTHSFLPAALSAFNSFWQHPLLVIAGIIAFLLVSGRSLHQMKPTPAASLTVCKEIAESRRNEKI